MTDLSPEALAKRDSEMECTKNYKPPAPYRMLLERALMWHTEGLWPDSLENNGVTDVLAFGLLYGYGIDEPDRLRKCLDRLEYLGLEEFLHEGIYELIWN